MTDHALILTRFIADKFRANMRMALSINQLIQIDALNKTTGFCVSPDFCDANEYMALAFEAVMGRKIDGRDKVDTTIWGAAWAFAKDIGFSWNLEEAWIELGGSVASFDSALKLCVGDPDVINAPLVTLHERFGITDPRFCLDMQRRVQEVSS